MRIETKEEIDVILNYCMAKKVHEVKPGGGFYSLLRQDFLYPDGKVQTREYVNNKKASVVVPITSDSYYIFVIQPVGLAEEGSLIEFPAGYIEKGEKSVTAGIRELAEETGYVAEEVIPLRDHYQNPGMTPTSVDVFLATNCSKMLEQKLDKGEFIKYLEIPRELAYELLDNNYFKDANTFIGFIKAERYLEKRKVIANSIVKK